MSDFTFIAQTNSGAIKRGNVSASTTAAVKNLLTLRGLRPISIQQSIANATVTQSLVNWSRRLTHRTLGSRDIETLMQQISVMLESGLELTASLRELSQQTHRPRVGRVCIELAQAIENGFSFEQALEKTGCFPNVICRLVRVGEQTGELPITLSRAAKYLERRRQAIAQLMSAFAYPLVVAVSACSVAVFLVGWTIPKLAVFLNSLGKELPRMTQSLLDLSAIVQSHAAHCGVIAVSLAIAAALLYAWEPSRFRIDRGILQVPVIGGLLRISETYKFASSLSLMLRSGVLIQDALNTASALHGNRFLAATVTQTRQHVSRGGRLADPLRGSGFAPLLPSMVAVGERTGDLPGSLDHVAQFYAEQLDAAIKRLSRIVEPAIIVIVGGLVGYVYASFFIALMSAGANF